ncbi:hypothetical protein [Streptomyces sp. NPDC046942]
MDPVAAEVSVPGADVTAAIARLQVAVSHCAGPPCPPMCAHFAR